VLDLPPCLVHSFPRLLVADRHSYVMPNTHSRVSVGLLPGLGRSKVALFPLYFSFLACECAPSNSGPEKIFQRQVAKEGLSNAIMDASRMAGDALKVPPRTPYLAARRCRSDLSPLSQARFTKEELRDIFSYNEFTACDTHELFGCECVVRTCPWAPAFIVALVSVVVGLQPLA